MLVLMTMMLCFVARHGRGAIDNVTITGEKVPATSPVVILTLATSMGVTENIMTGARPKHTPDIGYPLPSQKGQMLLWRKNIDSQQSIMLYHLWVQDIY